MPCQIAEKSQNIGMGAGITVQALAFFVVSFGIRLKPHFLFHSFA